MMLIGIIIFPLLFSFIIILMGKKSGFAGILAIISNGCSLAVSLIYYPSIMQKSVSVVLGNWLPPFGINLFFSSYSLGFTIIIAIISIFLLLTDFYKQSNSLTSLNKSQSDADDNMQVSSAANTYLNRQKSSWADGTSKKLVNSQTKKSADLAETDSRNANPGFIYIAHLLLTMAAMGMTVTADLFNLFVFAEIAGISSYLLIGSSGHHHSAASALKYLILSSVAGLLMLLGIALIYSSTGVLSMASLSNFLPLKPSLAFVGGFLLLLPFAVETKLFPFNTWVAGVYNSASIRTNALLSSLVGPVGLFVLIRLVFVVMNKESAFSPVFDKLRLVFILIASLTLFIGELAALHEKNLKKLLGFSTIGQLSMVLLGFLSGIDAIIKGAFLIFISTIAAKVLLFILTLYIYKNTNSYDWSFMRGFGRKNPFFGFLFFIGAFSLMGLPFAPSFWGKLELIRGFIYYGSYWYIALISVLIGTVFEGIYFMKLSHTLFLPVKSIINATETNKEIAENSSEIALQKYSINLTILIPSLILAGFIVAIGIFPHLAYTWIDSAVKELLQPSKYYIDLILHSGGGL